MDINGPYVIISNRIILLVYPYKLLVVVITRGGKELNILVKANSYKFLIILFRIQMYM